VRGADGGVALDVFDRPHARADRPRDVRDRGVALHVDELVLLAAGHPPQHQTRAGRGARKLGKPGGFIRWQTKLGQRRPGGVPAFAQATGKVHDAVGRARDADPGEVLAWDEAAERRVVAQHTAGLTKQVHRRIPAAAHQQDIA
jgi:hypothetical protein